MLDIYNKRLQWARRVRPLLLVMLLAGHCATPAKNSPDPVKTPPVVPAIVPTPAPAPPPPALQTERGRCDVTIPLAGRSLEYCVAYQQVTPEVAEAAAEACASVAGGRFVMDSDCRKEGRIGSCVYRSGQLSFTYYYYLPTTREEAKKSCLAAFEDKAETVGNFNDMNPAH